MIKGCRKSFTMMITITTIQEITRTPLIIYGPFAPLPNNEEINRVSCFSDLHVCDCVMRVDSHALTSTQVSAVRNVKNRREWKERIRVRVFQQTNEILLLSLFLISTCDSSIFVCQKKTIAIAYTPTCMHVRSDIREN